MNKDDLVHEIGNMLLQDSDIGRRSWKHLVMVAQIMPSSTKVNGFVYPGMGEAVPVSPDNFDILKKFKQLRDVMSEEGKEAWKACLLRIERESYKISIDFEYDHPEKWLISPATVRKMAEQLRPPSQ